MGTSNLRTRIAALDDVFTWAGHGGFTAAFFSSDYDRLLGRLFKFGDGRALVSELATDLIKSVLRRTLKSRAVFGCFLGRGRGRTDLSLDPVDLGNLLFLRRESLVNLGKTDCGVASEEEGDDADDDAADRNILLFSREMVSIVRS